MVLKIKESQVDRVNELVKSLCCNCDEGNCLLLEAHQIGLELTKAGADES